MVLSIFEIFKIGVGPSSSHTVGPMVAGGRFISELVANGHIAKVSRITIDLYGSLAMTGKGHATDRAVILGLMGEVPATMDADAAPAKLDAIHGTRRLPLPGGPEISFDPESDIIFRWGETLDFHTNGMTFTAQDAEGRELASGTYYSVGGGFVVDETESQKETITIFEPAPVAHDFNNGEEMLAVTAAAGLSIADAMRENEQARKPGGDMDAAVDRIWQVMYACIQRGENGSGDLPGGLNVPRRAPKLYRDLTARNQGHAQDPLVVMDWVNLWAMAVNEENAAGGQVVTAPTNGAAGVIPAVIRYAIMYHEADPDDIRTFLLTAAAIGSLYKTNASISGAEVGCQGEVGVACSMAAAGLAAIMRGTNAQIENAAEIGMEHNLGLTCDPVGGLVQIPCIERNAMGAIKAIDAARLAMLGDGTHKVSLDKVIETMRQTGLDMATKYKETSEGGLAVNVVEC